jgi:hypothetical protein
MHIVQAARYFLMEPERQKIANIILGTLFLQRMEFVQIIKGRAPELLGERGKNRFRPRENEAQILFITS